MEERVLVTGSRGLVGSRFVELYHHKYNLLLPSRDELDITNKAQVKNLLKEQTPSAIINFAAYTDVNGAEEQRGNTKGVSYAVNAQGPSNIASVINPKETKLIHISTDMVFSGSIEDKGPYSEYHEPDKDSDKVTWYGFTKAEGERAVKSILGEKAIILRLIYPVRAKFEYKLDYLRKPLQLFDEGKLYPMFTDQHVSITFIDEACIAIEKIIDNDYKGIFHASSSDTGTAYQLVSYLIEKARGKKNAVKMSYLDEFLKKVDNPIRYPKYGGLKVRETEEKLGISFSPWMQIIDKLIFQGIGK